MTSLPVGTLIGGAYRVLAPRPALSDEADVYSGEIIKKNVPVLIVFLREHLPKIGPAREAFEREGRALLAFKHPGVAETLDFGILQNAPFLVVAAPIGELIIEQIAVLRSNAEYAVRAIAAVHNAIETAHAAGFVHGDLGPTSLVLGPDGRAIIWDLAVVRLRRIVLFEAAPDGAADRAAVAGLARLSLASAEAPAEKKSAAPAAPRKAPPTPASQPVHVAVIQAAAQPAPIAHVAPPAPIAHVAQPAHPAPIGHIVQPAPIMHAAHPAPIGHIAQPAPIMHVAPPAPIAQPAPIMQVAQPTPVMHVAQPAPVMHVAQPAPIAHVAQPVPVMQVAQPAPIAHAAQPAPAQKRPTGAPMPVPARPADAAPPAPKPAHVTKAIAQAQGARPAQFVRIAPPTPSARATQLAARPRAPIDDEPSVVATLEPGYITWLRNLFASNAAPMKAAFDTGMHLAAETSRRRSLNIAVTCAVALVLFVVFLKV